MSSSKRILSPLKDFGICVFLKAMPRAPKTYKGSQYIGDSKAVFLQEWYVPPETTWSSLVDEIIKSSTHPAFARTHMFVCDNVDRNPATNPVHHVNQRVKDTLLSIYLNEKTPPRTLHILTVGLVPTTSFVMPPYTLPVLSPELQKHLI